MDAYSRSAARVELFARRDDLMISCGRATGFFFKQDNELFLITNWHVVTGLDPTTTTPVDEGPLPDALMLEYKQTVDANGQPAPGGPALSNFLMQIELYRGGAATWFEHSTRQNVDVVALSLAQFGFGEFGNIPINEVDQSHNMQPNSAWIASCLVIPKACSAPATLPSGNEDLSHRSHCTIIAANHYF